MSKDRDIHISVGNRIRQERERLGWSQEDLAEKAELHLSFIGQVERGIKAVSLKTLKRLADCLGVRASELLEESRPTRMGARVSVADKAGRLLRDRPPEQQRALYQILRIPTASKVGWPA